MKCDKGDTTNGALVNDAEELIMEVSGFCQEQVVNESDNGRGLQVTGGRILVQDSVLSNKGLGILTWIGTNLSGTRCRIEQVEE